MTWFFAVLVVLAIGAVAVVFAHGGGGLGPAYDDRADVVVSDGPVTGHDLREVRFNTAVRGYRSGEVDALLARLAAQLDDQQRQPYERPPER